MRQKLPDRRYCETFDDVVLGCPATFFMGYGRYVGDGVKEIFVNLSEKSDNSLLEVMLRDIAIMVSRELQHGSTPEDLAKSLTRDPKGAAAGPAGEVIDVIIPMNKRIIAEYLAREAEAA